MSIFDHKSIEQHVQNLDERIRGDKGLTGFITKDGEKHVGWYDPICNPCADIGHPDSIVKQYTDIYGHTYRDVKETFIVKPFYCFFWESSIGEYCLLKYPLNDIATDNNSLSLFDESFRKELIEDDGPSKKSLCQMIREWLLINSECDSAVYIEKDYSIRSDSIIKIKPDAKNVIPEYIHFCQ